MSTRNAPPAARSTPLSWPALFTASELDPLTLAVPGAPQGPRGPHGWLSRGRDWWNALPHRRNAAHPPRSGDRRDGPQEAVAPMPAALLETLTVLHHLATIEEIDCMFVTVRGLDPDDRTMAALALQDRSLLPPERAGATSEQLHAALSEARRAAISAFHTKNQPPRRR